MMNCKEMKEMLTEYIDKTLKDDKVILVEKHIKECRVCKDYIEKYNKFASVLRKQERKQSPDYLWTRISAKMKEENSKQGILQLIITPSNVFKLAGILVVFLVIYFYIGQLKNKRHEMVNNYLNEYIVSISGLPVTNGFYSEEMLENNGSDLFLENVFTE